MVARYAENDVLFGVFRTASYIDEREEIEFGEVSVFISQRFVITVRRGSGTGFQTARRRLENRPDLLKGGATAALWRSSTRSSTTTAPSSMHSTVMWRRPTR